MLNKPQENMGNKKFILTDGCMWEANKQSSTTKPHAVEVVDMETGEVRYIRSGSIVRFESGEISKTRTQECYDKKREKKTNA